MTQDKVENLSGKRSGPNVLFIITDQQRADNNGFMGNEVPVSYTHLTLPTIYSV